MATNQRNRIIYQSQALFMSPNSTKYHLQKAADGTADTNATTWVGITGIAAYNSQTEDLRSLTMPVERVQSANFNFSINRTDINEFGKLARIDSIVMESPTVGLDFNYYLTDGYNERLLGFNIPTDIDGSRASNVYNADDLCNYGKSALSGLIEDNQGNNYFIVVTKEGKDLDGSDRSASNDNFDVISIGNGFISDYSVEASVGAIPSASVSVEGFNIKVDDRISGGEVNNSNTYAPYVPAVNIENGQYDTTKNPNNGGPMQFVIQGAEATDVMDIGTDTSTIKALRPGDIVLTIGDAANYQGLTDLNDADDGEAHIQSFSISIPMSRTVLGRLGNTFGYARVIDLPLNVDISISAVVSEYNVSNIFQKLCSTQKHNFTLALYTCNTSTGGRSDVKAIEYQIKGARLESENFSNAIGDNQTVDITFSCQVGGANDTNNGVFMLGRYNKFRCLKYWPLGANKDDDASYGVV